MLIGVGLLLGIARRVRCGTRAGHFRLIPKGRPDRIELLSPCKTTVSAPGSPSRAEHGRHLFPGVAVAEALKQRGCAVTLLISPKESTRRR